MLPASVIHVVRTVIILENELIDWLSAIDNFTDYDFSPAIRPLWRISYCNTDSAGIATLRKIVDREIQVIFSVLFNHGRSPKSLIEFRNMILRDDLFVLGPVHKILGREAIQKELLLERLAPCRKYPICVTKHRNLRVSIPLAVPKRISCHHRLAAGSEKKHQRC